jgi:hypothetical protein
MNTEEDLLTLEEKDFLYHIFSETQTSEWKRTHCDEIINENMNNICEVMARIKASSINLPNGVNNYSSIKKFLQKVKLSKRPKGELNFKSVFGYNIPGYKGQKTGIDRKKTKVNFKHGETIFRDNLRLNTIKSDSDIGLSKRASTLKMTNQSSFENLTIEPYTGRLSPLTKSPFGKLPLCNTTKISPIKIQAYTSRTDKAPKSYREIKREYEKQLQEVSETIQTDKNPYRLSINTISLTELNREDKYMFEKKMKDGYTDRFVKQERDRINKQTNPDYDEDEIKTIRKELKPKGIFIEVPGGKKKYYSIERENIHNKDYYINTITERSALTYKKMLSQKYLVNSKKDLMLERLGVANNRTNVLGNIQHEINRVNLKMRGKFYNILNGNNK